MNNWQRFVEAALFFISILTFIALIVLVGGYIAAFVFGQGNILVALGVPWGILAHGLTRIILALAVITFVAGALDRTWPGIYFINFGITLSGWVFLNYVQTYSWILMAVIVVISIALAYLTIMFGYHIKKAFAVIVFLGMLVAPSSYYLAASLAGYFLGIGLISIWKYSIGKEGRSEPPPV